MIAVPGLNPRNLPPGESMKTLPCTDKDTQPAKIGEWVRDSTTHRVPVWIMTGLEVSEVADLNDEIEIEIDGGVTEVWLPLELLAQIMRANGYTVSKP